MKKYLLFIVNVILSIFAFLLLFLIFVYFFWSE